MLPGDLMQKLLIAGEGKMFPIQSLDVSREDQPWGKCGDLCGREEDFNGASASAIGEEEGVMFGAYLHELPVELTGEPGLEIDRLDFGMAEERGLLRIVGDADFSGSDNLLQVFRGVKCHRKHLAQALDSRPVEVGDVAVGFCFSGQEAGCKEGKTVGGFRIENQPVGKLLQLITEGVVFTGVFPPDQIHGQIGEDVGKEDEGDAFSGFAAGADLDVVAGDIEFPFAGIGARREDGDLCREEFFLSFFIDGDEEDAGGEFLNDFLGDFLDVGGTVVLLAVKDQVEQAGPCDIGGLQGFPNAVEFILNLFWGDRVGCDRHQISLHLRLSRASISSAALGPQVPDW